MTTPDTVPAVACIGAANDDRRLRLSGPYQPATSNPVLGTASAGGVARNVAEALGRLGVDVRFFGVVGQDGAGYALAAGLKAAGVDVAALIRDPDHATGSYTAVVEADGGLVCGLADMSVYDTMTPQWLAGVMPKLDRCAVWCVDANLPAATLAALAGAASPDTLLFADPVSAVKASRLAPVLGRAAAVFPDRAEAAALTGLAVDSPDDAVAAATALVGVGVGCAYVSLGADGVAVADADGAAVYQAIPADRGRDVTGAGDAFMAGAVYRHITPGPKAPPPVAFGLAAANLTLQAPTAVPADLDPRRLHQHAADHWRNLPSTP